eukprot:763959-Hanusia_phi.AAC.5
MMSSLSSVPPFTHLLSSTPPPLLTPPSFSSSAPLAPLLPFPSPSSNASPETFYHPRPLRSACQIIVVHLILNLIEGSSGADQFLIIFNLVRLLSLPSTPPTTDAPLQEGIAASNIDYKAAKRVIYMLTNFFPERMVRTEVFFSMMYAVGSLPPPVCPHALLSLLGCYPSLAPSCHAGLIACVLVEVGYEEERRRAGKSKERQGESAEGARRGEEWGIHCVQRCGRAGRGVKLCGRRK